MFRGSYRPAHRENRMRHEGDTRCAREYFLNAAPANLKLLVEKRFVWMNRHIEPDDVGLEIGCGTGASRAFILAKHFYLTYVADYDWLDYRHVDALNTPFADEQFDFVVSSNMVHQLAHPLALFREMDRILKPGGKLLIQEINGSLAMRMLLNLMRHEGHSYDVDVFDENCVCNDPDDPWSANCVIPNPLWDDPARFERHVPAFKIVHHRYREFSTLIRRTLPQSPTRSSSSVSVVSVYSFRNRCAISHACCARIGATRLAAKSASDILAKLLAGWPCYRSQCVSRRAFSGGANRLGLPPAIALHRGACRLH